MAEQGDQNRAARRAAAKRARRKGAGAVSTGAVVAGGLTSIIGAPAAHAADFEVDTEAELIDAIDDANANPDADTITITADITLTGALPGINEALTIESCGCGYTIDADGVDRVFYINVDPGTDVTIENLVLANGDAGGADHGGAIKSVGADLAVRDVEIRDSDAGGDGGGIYVAIGTLELVDSLVSGNTATDFGGGVYIADSESRIENTTVKDNTAYVGGGVALQNVIATIESSTLSANTATYTSGGAIVANLATLSLVNTTVANNSAADDGGGIASTYSELTLMHATIAGNDASSGGGIRFLYAYDGRSTLTSVNTVIDGNTATYGPDIDGSPDDVDVLSVDTSTISDSSNSGGLDLSGFDEVDVALEPLYDNGGPVETMLIPDDPAVVDAGTDTGSLPDDDARGFMARIVGSGPDLGAVELVQDGVPASLVVTDGGAEGPGTLRDAVLTANGTLAADTITFDVATATPDDVLDVVNDVTIAGAAGGSEVTGGGEHGIFRTTPYDLYDTLEATVSGLTLRDGYADDGGAIRASRTALTLTDVSLLDNAAADTGGAVSVAGGTLVVDGATFVGNAVYGSGGGAIGARRTVSVSISDSTFTGNEALYGDGGAMAIGARTIELSGVTMTDNTAGVDGGGARLEGPSTTVTDSTITGNAALRGGGLSVYYGDAAIERTTVADNEATIVGGGVYVGDSLYAYGETLTVTDSTISGNVAPYGGGVTSAAAMQLVQSTVSSNEASYGGGVLALSFYADHSTIVGNAATEGANVYADQGSLDHTVVADASGGGDDVHMRLTPLSASYSLVEDDDDDVVAVAGTLFGVDPVLGALTDNGGSTLTHLPGAGSPLVDAGDPAVAGAPDEDQRGGTRVVRVIDIGAVEVQASSSGNDNDNDDDSGADDPGSPPELHDGNVVQPDRRVEGQPGDTIVLPPTVDGETERVEVAVVTDEGEVSIVVENAGEGTRVTIREMDPDDIDGDRRGIRFLDRAYAIDVEGDGKDSGGVVCLPFDADEVERNGWDEADLQLFHFDEDGSRQVITTTVDHANNRVCGRVDSFSPFAVGTLATRRLAGSTAARTAADISRATFDPGVPAVHLVARGPDGLGAGAAAAALGGPVLLVDRDEVPVATLLELERLQPARVVVVGGSGVISDAVVEQVGGTRVAGVDRYATAAALSAATFPTAPTVYLASGESPADALVAGAAAAAAGGPLLLVTKDAVPPVTAAELARLQPGRVVVVGGTAAVSDVVVDLLGAERVAGTDRYSTAAAVAVALGRDNVFVVRGDDPVDAAAAIPAAEADGAAVVYVTPTAIPAGVLDLLRAIDPAAITVIGGTAAVSLPVEVELAVLLDS